MTWLLSKSRHFTLTAASIDRTVPPGPFGRDQVEALLIGAKKSKMQHLMLCYIGCRVVCVGPMGFIRVFPSKGQCAALSHSKIEIEGLITFLVCV